MAPPRVPRRFLGGCALTSTVLLASLPNSMVAGVGRLLARDRAPLHTQGRYIVDRLGERVKWACVNYFGAESKSMVAGGMEVRPVEDIARRVPDLGFNCVRIPYSSQAVLENPPIEDQFLAGNPKLKGKRFLDVFNATVNAFTDLGVMVILDNHVLKAGWCCFPAQDEGLWYVDDFPTEKWIEGLVKMTTFFKPNSMVVGHTLKNEVHDYGGVQLTWGDGNPATDWHLMTTRAGNKVLEANRDMLVVVMAICSGICLSPARDHPVILDVPHRVVYEAHNYAQYVFTNMIPRNLISWDHLRLLLLVPVGIWMAIAGKIARDWRSQDWQKLPQGGVLQTLGWWIFGVGVVECLLVGLVIVVWTHLACYWWSHNVVINWLCYPLVLTACGLVTALYGRWIPRGRVQGGVFEDAEGDGDEEPGDKEFGYGEMRLLSFSEEEPSAPFWRCWRIQIVFGGLVLSGFLLYIIHCVNVWSTYEWERSFLDDWFGFLLEEGQPFTAPVWMGEFGYANQGVYWMSLARYLSDRDMDFAYWALNGKKYGEGYINDESGSFIKWAGCFTEVQSMGGTSCEAQLGDWAYEGRDYTLDVMTWDSRPDACVHDVVTMGTCESFCHGIGRKCLKGSPRAAEDKCSWNKPAWEALKASGCLENLEEQICVCTRVLWKWDNETFGLLDLDYQTLRVAWRVRDLQALAESPSTWVPRDIGCLRDAEGVVCDEGEGL